MSITSYIYISDKSETVPTEGTPDIPKENIRTFYRVMDTGLESLATVISNEKENLEMVGANEEYTNVLYKFPETFTNKLAKINQSDIADFITKWLKSEDCPYDNENDLKDLIIALNKFSSWAIEKSFNLYFKMEM